MAEEYHVASYVVTAKPGDETAVGRRIGAMPGLEVHAGSNGKLVVTAEADDVRILADLVARLEAVEDVVTVAPVYHEYEDAGRPAAVPSRNSLNNRGK